MKKLSVLLGVVIGLLLVVSYFAGYRVGFDKLEELTYRSVYNAENFYAEIESIDDTRILVKGMDINDASYRGEFYFLIDNKVRFKWRDLELDVSVLEVGDRVLISYVGHIHETAPAEITRVVKVQLLEDEM